MKGTLLVNHFLSSSHFARVHALFAEAAEKKGISLVLKTAADFPEQKDITKESTGDFVLFWDKDVLFGKALRSGRCSSL